MLITIQNNFHGSSTKLNIKVDGKVSLSQERRAKKAICGVGGCQCGGIYGPHAEVEGMPGAYFAERFDRSGRKVGASIIPVT